MSSDKSSISSSAVIDVGEIQRINPYLADYYEREVLRRAHDERASDEEAVASTDSDAKSAVSRMINVPEEEMHGIPEEEMHGILGVGRRWNPPLLVTYCDKAARPGYQSMLAHEYQDDDSTMRSKISLLADLIRRSTNLMLYTGAGISTASGIDDYASKAAETSAATGSKAAGRSQKRKGRSASPTFAHFSLAALFRAGHLKNWVQQNHDGLPQKAGLPQEVLNEIHGSWYDPSNPVVPMSGTLRADLTKWLKSDERKTDLVIAVGTSLCGMSADSCVITPSRKFLPKKNRVGLGSVIIGFQRTQLDDLSSLRIFGRIDEVMLRLMHEMQIPVTTLPYTLVVPANARTADDHVVMVPYDQKSGLPTKDGSLQPWDLRSGVRVKCTGGPGAGFIGTIVAVPCYTSEDDCESYIVSLPTTREGSPDFGKVSKRYLLGTWWIDAAIRKSIPQLPLVNI